MCGKLYFLHFFFFPGACYSCKRVQLHCEMHSPHCAGSCSLNRHATLAEPQLGSKMETQHNQVSNRTSETPLALPHQLN